MKLSFALLLVGATAALRLDAWEDVLLQEPTSSDESSGSGSSGSDSDGLV